MSISRIRDVENLTSIWGAQVKCDSSHPDVLSRDIHYIIVELESAIIRELEELVLDHSGILLQLANILAELDWFVPLGFRKP